MNDGFIKLQRKLFASDLWLNGEFDYGKAWVDLIAMANYADVDKFYKGNYQKVKRGQIVTSIRTLAERWNWSRGRVSHFLTNLEEAGMVATDRATNWTVITLVNYRVYQDGQATKWPQTEPQKSHRKATERPRTDTQEEYKERKKENNLIRTAEASDRLEDYGGLFLTDKQWTDLEEALGPSVLLEYADKVASWLEDNPRQKKTHVNVLKKFLRNDGLIK